MNEILQNIMIFINQNTYLLIGICVFLIFVLIGYLIDNSVKSKRVRKDIKNKDQVPENIKNEIIKEAINENKEKIMENSFHNVVREESQKVKSEEVDLKNKNTEVEETINMELNLDEITKQEDLNASLNLDNTSISAPFSLDNNESNSLVIDTSLPENYLDKNISIESSEFNLNNNDIKNDELDSSFVLDIKNENNKENLVFDTPVNVDLIYPIDPDINIMNINTQSNKYTNDKKLSEILLNVDKQRINNNIEEIVPLIEKNKSNIEVNNDIKNEENDSDELDKIMRKLSSMNNEDEDNYTNIF